ncbi:NAD(P)/FAD-dependent oxidoreductase [Flavobacterium sp. SLB02]|uniref:NAD(P)/FAD-dependent oxidoreductase n=1 Tax=Flavobacterium sp. SLB02 TaxID=2665645 RepID=UPI0012A7FED7|nr:FAD-dependent monooxygenase [Flavobacterium sp. SLB02]QGK75278.1 hypothetical protein GIY83_14690 [Flavobacterium sp. SLB02]
MMEQELYTDICVIGGGPGGATISMRLSELANHVILLEKDAFPRPHVGICLSNETDALLDYLGVGNIIKQEAFLQRKSTLLKWGSDRTEIVEQTGRHVDRGRFDQILIKKAMDSGVQVIQPARTQSIIHKKNQEWIIKAYFKGKTILIYAKFLVDASGRSASLQGKRIRNAPSLFALHAVWNLRSKPQFDGFMEAGKNAWLWTALLNESQCMISLYTDPSYISHNGHRNLQNFYCSNLENFSLVKLLDLDGDFGKVYGCDASSRYSLHPVGDDFIRVGDANFAIDPMASQGVHLALNTAIQAAIVVNTLIHYPEHANTARIFYRDRQQERINQFRERTIFEYSKAAINLPYPFWEKRSKDAMSGTRTQIVNLTSLTVTQKLRVCPLAKIISTPVMKDRWIELAPALHHPELSRPVAFLADKNIDLLFHYFKDGQTIIDILDRWKSLVSEDTGTQIIQWLWENHVLISVAEGRS